MANPTTNFGWVMPTSASLVTDLPADFNVFGQAVDTSMQYLLGGTTGQVLSKTSGTNMAFTWTTPTDQTPLTTKGDLFTFTTVDARLAVGANDTALVADSTQSTGLAYKTKGVFNGLTTTGDTIYSSSGTTQSRLGIGSTGQVLTVASGVPSWATPASGLTFAGVSVHNDYYSITFTAYTDQFLAFASADQWDTNAYHDPTTNNTRLTIPTGAGGKYLLTCFFSGGSSTQKLFTLKVNGSTPASLPVGVSGSMAAIRTAGDPLCFSIVLNLAAADYVQMAVQANATGTESGCYNTLQLSYLGA